MSATSSPLDTRVEDIHAEIRSLGEQLDVCETLQGAAFDSCFRRIERDFFVVSKRLEAIFRDYPNLRRTVPGRPTLSLIRGGRDA